jgi:EmrB/QacA subfamily drug resistance transporter
MTSTAADDARAPLEASAFSLENPDPMRWKALAVIGVAQLMVVLDASIVNLALPRAKADLGITDADQQWVLTAYTLAFGGLLLLGGRIADYAGRKRVFIIGLIGFAAASALGAMTPNAGFLYGARALQGAFGALLAPAALSLMTVTFHAPKERARAFGVFGAVSGGGAAVGLLLGGVLTEYLSWRWCLLINTPIAIVAGLLALRYVRESRASGGTSYDVAGALTVTIGLVALVYGFTKAAPKGLQDTAHWGEASTLIWFVLAAVLLVAFFVVEARHPNPLLPLRILLERNRGGSYLIMLIVGIGMFAMFLFLGLYLQVVRGYTPIAAGFAFLPFSAGIVVGAGIASQLVPRLGPRPVLVPGLLASAVALVWMSRLTVDSSYVGHLLPAMLIMSVGMAFVFIPIATTALHGIGHEDAGVGSALINTAQQIGGSVGVALLNTVAVIATTSFLTEHAADGPGALPEALTAGYTRAFLVGAVINVVAAVLALVLINIGREAAQEGDEEGEVAVVHAG